MSYYNHHDGTLFPGKIARSEDINQIQNEINEGENINTKNYIFN